MPGGRVPPTIELPMALNNRETATLILLGCGLLWALSYRPTRESIADLLRTLAKPVLLVPLGLLVGYVGLLAYGGSRLGIWSLDLLSTTVIWFFTLALVAYMNVHRALKDKRFVRRVALRTIEFSVLVEFVAGLYPMALPWEIALQLLALVLVVMITAAKTKRELRPFELVGESLLGVAGLVVIAHSLSQVVANWNDLDVGGIALEIMLPIWMTAAFLPFLYLFTLFAGYDGPVRQMRRLDAPIGAQLKAIIALAFCFRTNRVQLARLGFYWTKRMVEADSIRGAMAVAKDVLAREEAREREVAAARQRLIDYAGVEGEDADGRRLDRREFEETTAALHWLATCQMGHYRRLGRYPEDLLEIVERSSAFDKLPDDHGIKMDISDDGQSWWAWRRTVSGWYFAIGAAGPPPDQWRFDGPEPPSGPPGVDPAWGEEPFSMDKDTNW